VALVANGANVWRTLLYQNIAGQAERVWEPPGSDPGLSVWIGKEWRGSRKDLGLLFAAVETARVVFINTRFPLEWYDILDQLPDSSRSRLPAIRSPMRQCVTFGN